MTIVQYFEFCVALIQSPNNLNGASFLKGNKGQLINFQDLETALLIIFHSSYQKGNRSPDF